MVQAEQENGENGVRKMKEYDMVFTISELKRYVAMLEDENDTVLFAKVRKIKGSDQMTIVRESVRV